MAVNRIVLYHFCEQQRILFAGAGGGIEGLVKRFLTGEKFVQRPQNLLPVQRLVFINSVPLGPANGPGRMHGYHMEILIYKHDGFVEDLVGYGNYVVGALVADRFVELFIYLGHTGRSHNHTSA